MRGKVINMKKQDAILLSPERSKLIIEYITQNNLLHDEGIIVCEAEHDTFTKEYKELENFKFKKYGYKFIRV